MMSFKFDVHNFLQMDVFFWEEKKLIDFIIKTQEVKSSCRKAQTSGLGELPKPQIMDYGV